MTSLYDRIAGEPDGRRRLASARLRRRVLVLLHEALGRSELNQSDLAKKLGIRKSAVNQVFRGDGNVRIDTLADYLHELGLEAEIKLVPAGTHRRAFTVATQAANAEASTSFSVLEVDYAGAPILRSGGPLSLADYGWTSVEITGRNDYADSGCPS